MFRRYIFIIILFMQGFYLLATSQKPDILIYNGIEYNLHVNPMESWFIQFPEKRPSSDYSSLWRGYIAVFEIIQNELWVIDIKKTAGIDRVYGTLNYESIMNECFEGKDKIKMDWFNGMLIFNLGNTLMDNISTYDYILIEIRNGNLENIVNMNNEQYREFIKSGTVEYLTSIH